jgi:hypothetical protein
MRGSGFRTRRLSQGVPRNAFVSAVVALFALQFTATRAYNDPQGRFAFEYPAEFGATSPGTDDGFEDRLAAVRFAAFPATYGGEAALTRGFPLIDLQAVGGLYDSLTLQIFPAPLRAQLRAQLQPLTAATFCAALRETTHLDSNLPAFAAWTAPQRQAIAQTDAMRNASARVVQCRVSGETVVFDKERAFQPGSPLQHVYGAVRFLAAPYSTFQVVAGGAPPTAALLKAIEEIVGSFRAG